MTNIFSSSSFAKDYEDKVQDFYDCDLSSIENSDFEDDFFLPLSFETDSSLDNRLVPNCNLYET